MTSTTSIARSLGCRSCSLKISKAMARVTMSTAQKAQVEGSEGERKTGEVRTKRREKQSFPDLEQTQPHCGMEDAARMGTAPRIALPPIKPCQNTYISTYSQLEPPFCVTFLPCCCGQP